jgi:PST family polysaccharide transporter
MALSGWGVWSLAGAQLSQSAIKALGVMIVEPHPKTPSLNRQASRDLLWFGGGLTVARIGNYFGVQGDAIVVGRFLGAEALGVYGRAYQLMSNPAMFLGQILDRVLFPAMSKVQDRAGELKKVFRRGVVLIALVILPGSTAMCVLAPEVVRVVLGPGWEAAVNPFRILALGMLFRTSYKMSDALARAAGAVYRRAWRMWIYGALVMGGAALGSPWGVEGATWCVMLAIGCNFLLMAQLSLGLIEMTWGEFLKAHVPALRLTVFTVSMTWAGAALLRPTGWPALVVGAGALLVPAAGIALGGRYAPAFTLGEDGRWILRTLGEYLPGRRASSHQPAFRGEP